MRHSQDALLKTALHGADCRTFRVGAKPWSCTDTEMPTINGPSGPDSQKGSCVSVGLASIHR